jgi:hypothetical protein
VYENTCLPTCICTHEHAYICISNPERGQSKAFQVMIKHESLNFLSPCLNLCVYHTFNAHDHHVWVYPISMYMHTHARTYRFSPSSRSSTRCWAHHHGACMYGCICMYIYIQTRICTRTYRFSPWFQEQHKMFGAASRRRCVTLCVPRSISSWVRYVVCPSLHQQLGALRCVSLAPSAAECCLCSYMSRLLCATRFSVSKYTCNKTGGCKGVPGDGSEGQVNRAVCPVFRAVYPV